MPRGLLGWDDPAAPDKYLDTYNRSYTSNSTQQQVIIFGEPIEQTYTFTAQSVATTTSASHLAFIQGDGTNYTRVNWFEFAQQTMGTAAVAEIRVYRTTTAGTGGTSISCYPTDPHDTSPYAGVAMTLPTSKGTEGVLLHQFRLPLVASTPTLGTYRWERSMWEKPLIIPAGTINGLVWKLVTGIATDTLNITIGFTTTATL